MAGKEITANKDLEEEEILRRPHITWEKQRDYDYS